MKEYASGRDQEEINRPSPAELESARRLLDRVADRMIIVAGAARRTVLYKQLRTISSWLSHLESCVDCQESFCGKDSTRT